MCLFLITLLLAGCSSSPGPVDIPRTLMAGAAPGPEPLEFVFTIDRNSPQPIKNAAQAFCDRIAEDSGGALQATVKESTNAFAGLAAGQAQLAFAPLEKLPDVNSRFDALNAPFLYRGYRHFSMSLNSEEVLDMIGDSLPGSHHATPLAGFYLGASYLLTSVTLESPADLMELFASGGEITALVKPASILQGGLTELGFTVSSQPSYVQRLRQLSEGGAVLAEFSLSELTAFREQIDSSLRFIPSIHSVDMQLLCASSEFWDDIPGLSRAMITEAFSRLFPVIDENALLRETMLQQEMTEREMLQTNFPGVIQDACIDAWSAGLEPDPLRDYLSDLISSI